MPKRTKQPVDDASKMPYVANYPPLQEFLDAHEAVCMWQRPMGEPFYSNGSPRAFVECWQFGSRLAIITVWGDRMGWEIYTPAPTNKVDETLADAEQRLGLQPAQGAQG